MKKRLIAFRIPPDLDDMAQSIANKKGKTKTDVFIIALKNYIDYHKGNFFKYLFK